MAFIQKVIFLNKEEVYRIIIGSSNMTKSALTTNREWNTKIVSTGQGEMTREILKEFDDLWSSPYALAFEAFFDSYREKYNIIKRQREIARKEQVTSIENYKLQPNSMQVGFISNLRKILQKGEQRALLISATGTGKTFASAFAMQELGFKRVLFLVHRGQLARQTKKSFEKVFGRTVSMGLVGAGYHDYDKDYIFATVQTLNKDTHLMEYKPDAFDCIVLDEAHHTSADTYQKVMNYFTPRLWLGMTATPDKRDDNIAGRNIYEIFHYQIAYEIRLQQAMEENLLCPFHYFGISDISLLDDKQLRSGKISERDFHMLTGEERVRHIVEQAAYFGYSGDRVKGLVFCSRIEEAVTLSEKFNQIVNPETGRCFRTIALSGKTSEEDRQRAFERLAMNENDAAENNSPLDYIFSVEILNEGVDIVEVNQVIMLRPTESPIVFIQQLGRGLRKAAGKEFVVVLDFIGNYSNNFMIPIALSGDRSYNADTIRKYVISGNNTIPGASTVHFDEISKNKIFASIDKIKGMKSIIRESYVSLKNRIGRIPYLLDFYENGEIDPLVIIREYKTYWNLLEAMESLNSVEKVNSDKMTEEERTTLEYLSKTVLSGARPYELEILRRLLKEGNVDFSEFNRDFAVRYGYEVNVNSFDNAVEVLQGKFVSKEEEYRKYAHMDILREESGRKLTRLTGFAKRLQNAEFLKQVDDIIEVGLRRYADKYQPGVTGESPFVLYEKYSRRDVSLLMNCGKDLSSTMYGMKRIGNDTFIFVTYHKEESKDDRNYAEGKPDYADAFEDNRVFLWDSQLGRGVESSYVADVIQAGRKHLFVKKSDAETGFYYMGQFDVTDVRAAKKKDNTGKMRDIAKLRMKMHHAVREDLLRYLQSNITTTEEKVQ